MKSRERVNQWIEDSGKLMPDEDRESLIFEFEESAQEQKSACTAAVDMAFHHAKSHGYTEEETESHVMMACLHAGEIDEQQSD